MLLALKIIAGIIVYIAFVFFVAACMGIYKKAGGYDEYQEFREMYYQDEREGPNESNISNNN